MTIGEDFGDIYDHLDDICSVELVSLGFWITVVVIQWIIAISFAHFGK